MNNRYVGFVIPALTAGPITTVLTAANARHAWEVLKDRGNIARCREAGWLAYPPNPWMCHHEIQP